MLILVYD